MNMNFWVTHLGLGIALGLAVAACSSDGDSAPANQTPAAIEIAGTWSNPDFGETDVIDDQTWSSDFGSEPTVSTIEKFSNRERYAIRRAPDHAAFNPGTFDRVAWTQPDGDHFYYCAVTYGCDTAALTATGDGDDSEDSPNCNVSSVDASDPENGGCGSFAWTKLTAP
jgi:hypothetical protein